MATVYEEKLGGINRVNEAAGGVTKALQKFVTVALEENDADAIDAMIMTIMGVIAFRSSVTCKWQMDAVNIAWIEAKAALQREGINHGID